MIRSIYLLSILIIFLVSVDIDAQKNKAQNLNPSKIKTVDFCYLVNNPQLFSDKVIRVRGIFYTAFPDVIGLYNRHCEHKGISPVLDCDGEESCKDLRQALAQNNSFNGDVSRVEIIAVGNLKIISDNTKRGDNPLEFYISRIERTIKIGSDVPFP